MAKKSLMFLSFVILASGLLLILRLPSGPRPAPTADNAASQSMQLRDAHGLAVDRQDPSVVYIATHSGLLALKNDRDLQEIGSARDDYMGFTAHPTDANTFYASGHSRQVGNLGFQKTTDGGTTWQKISEGLNGPVDFHTMAVSLANPRIFYGWSQGQLQRSDDEGVRWTRTTGTVTNVISLTTSPIDENVVFAATTKGLMVSRDRGDTWSSTQLTGLASAVSSNPANDRELMAFVQPDGLMRSTNDGETWNEVAGYNGPLALHIAYDFTNPATIYLINQSLEIHKSIDGGERWNKVR